MDSSSPFEEFVQPTLNQEAVYHLRAAAKWTRFLSILGFVFLGLNVLSALGLIFFSSSMLGEVAPFAGPGLSIVFLIFTGLVFLPIYYQYSFSRNAKIALDTNDPVRMEEAFRFLNAHYRFFGILTIIVFSLYALIFVAAMVGAVFAG